MLYWKKREEGAWGLEVERVGALVVEQIEVLGYRVCERTCCGRLHRW